MAIIKCKMCGGDLILVEGQSVAECDSCGIRQTVPNPDNEKKLLQFERAERLRKNCEFDKAAALYEAIVAEHRQEAEAYWGLVLCKYGIEYVDDPATGKKIPTCHRSSFESILDDPDVDQVLENADVVARKVYREEVKQIEEIRKGIIAVSANEEPYDIFICYKETDENGERTLDSVLAQDLYDALTDKGYRVFFARITLEDKLGREYEPYIFAALNSAKVMLAVGTDYEYFNAVWVKNEWSRFLKLMTQNKEKFLIPCFKGIDAYDMPREFARLQAQDLGKMGAIQDLLRNMEKYIPRKTQQTVVVQTVTAGDGKVNAALQRGMMALEDGEWEKADGFFEEVLNNDAMNAQAYIGKTLATARCRNLDAFVAKRTGTAIGGTTKTKTLLPEIAREEEAVSKYTLAGYLAESTVRSLYKMKLEYFTETESRAEQLREQEKYWSTHKLLTKAEKFAAGKVAEDLRSAKERSLAPYKQRLEQATKHEIKAKQELQERYATHLEQADQTAAQMHADALKQRRDDYENWSAQAEKTEDPAALRDLASSLKGLGDFENSLELAQQCHRRADEIQAKLDAKAEAERKAAEKLAEEKRKAEAEAAAAKKKKNTIIGVVGTIVVIIAIVAGIFIAKSAKEKKEEAARLAAYESAVTMLAEGEYAEAIAAFESLGDYQDSAAKLTEAQQAKQAADEAAAEAARLAAYEDGKAKLESGDYSGAVAALESLDGYEDSADLLLEARYQYAVSLLDQQSYEEAYNQLHELGDYQDAATYLGNLVQLPVYVNYRTATGGHEEFYFTYENGKMVGGYRDAYDKKSPVYVFDDAGRVIREDNESGTYTTYSYNNDGEATYTSSKGVSYFFFNQYGVTAGTYKDGILDRFEEVTMDEHNNPGGKYYANTYDETGKLIQVNAKINNYYAESHFTYEWFYFPDGVDQDLIWKNIRIICKTVW